MPKQIASFKASMHSYQFKKTPLVIVRRRQHGILLRDLRLQDTRNQQARVAQSSGPSLYEVCEQAPASSTCKVDTAALCVTCDHDFHSAIQLALRHERLPVVPFYNSATDAKSHGSAI
nr:zinc finger protein CONSTANS-LIKE 4-like [Ipomoea batatas]